MPKLTKLEDVSLTKMDFCRLLGDISPRTVEKWIEAGIPRQAVGKNRWRYGWESVVWAWSQLRDSGKKSGSATRSEKERLEVEKLQLEVNRDKGLYIPVSTLEEVLADICGRFNAKIQALPRKWAADLIEIEEMGPMVDRLDELKEELRAELRAEGDD